MTTRRPLALLAASVCVALSAGALQTATGAPGADPGRPLPDVRVMDRVPTAGAGKITGTDGVDYDNAPLAVEGRKHWLYFGPDFDNACSLGAGGLKEAAAELAKVANIIRQSGRRVVWTMAPNKSVPLQRYLVPKNFPHGRCDRKNLADQTRFMRSYDPPGYLSMVDSLAASKHEVYWKTDPHWSTVGGAIFAKEIARVLDPRLAKIQRSTYGTETGVGSLNLLRGINTPETLERAYPATKVKVTQDPGETPWAGYPEQVFDTSWTTKPKNRTWPGRTLIICDSFSMFALESLRPLFRHGRWMWFAHVALQDLVQAIKQSDTVVLEVFELYVPNTIVATRSFRTELKQALR